MTAPHEKYAAQRPRKGAQVSYRGVPIGTVSSVEGGLCWLAYHDPKIDFAPFIWCFRDGLNQLFDWPTKGRTDHMESLE